MTDLKKELIQIITDLIQKTDDVSLLDLIVKLLKKSGQT